MCIDIIISPDEARLVFQTKSIDIFVISTYKKKYKKKNCI